MRWSAFLLLKLGYFENCNLQSNETDLKKNHRKNCDSFFIWIFKPVSLPVNARNSKSFRVKKATRTIKPYYTNIFNYLLLTKQTL